MLDNWKKEHRIALAIAAGVGGVVGLILGFVQRGHRYLGLGDWMKEEPMDALLWLVIGAAVVVGVIVAWREFST